MRMSKAMVLAASLMLLMFVAPGISSADSYAGAPTDILNVYDSSGGFVDSAAAYPGDPIQLYTISDDTTLANPAMWGKYTIVLESPTGAVSDFFGVVKIGGSFYLGFTTDSGSTPDPAFGSGGTTFTVYESTSSTFDATKYLNPNNPDLQGATATFTSAPVPLPASLLLFAPGLAGFAAMRRRFRKTVI